MAQSKQKWQYRVIDGKDVIDSEIVVHRFSIHWEDDASLPAASSLLQWEQSDAGKWVKEHAVETPRWIQQENLSMYSVDFAVIARLTEQDQTFFKLRFI